MNLPLLDTTTLQARYALLCRASQQAGDEHPLPPEVQQHLAALHNLIAQQLPALARKGGPDDIADLLNNMQQEFQRLNAFCQFPQLGDKVIVGIGGAFSSGKSSLINTLLGGEKRLATEVDETTALPGYLLYGEQEQIFALNLFGRRISLEAQEFLSLTHEEKTLYGSQVGALLQSAWLTLPAFPWRNLALLDTPGYSKPDDPQGHQSSDAQIARTQLNACQYIIWLVQADAGVISENDLAFLTSLRRDIPLLVVVSRADKKTPEDIAAVVSLIRTTLAMRGVTVLDVVPFSSRKKQLYPVEPLLTSLARWDETRLAPTFAINFSRLFLHYRQYLDGRRRINGQRLNRINRILSLAEGAQVQQDAIWLQRQAKRESSEIEQQEQELDSLQKQFFAELAGIGQAAGITIPPAKLEDLLQPTASDLLMLLRTLREQQDLPEPADSLALMTLMRSGELTNRSRLLREVAPAAALLNLNQPASPTRLVELLRQPADGAYILNLLP